MAEEKKVVNGNNEAQETEKKEKKGFIKKACGAVKGAAKKSWPVVKKTGSVAVKALTVAGVGYTLYAGIKTNRKPSYEPLLNSEAYKFSPVETPAEVPATTISETDN